MQLRAHQTAQPAGFYRLLFDDFQGLDTDTLERSAAPWKFLAAATVGMRGLEPSESAYIAFLRREYGFLVPERIENWPQGAPQTQWTRPLGIVSGIVSRRRCRLRRGFG